MISLEKKIVTSALNALQQTDDVAFYNVTHGEDGQTIVGENNTPIKGRFSRGGPFGALVAVSYDNQFEIIGQPRGNNVIGSGIASRHAEDQALQADNYEKLVVKLQDLKAIGKDPFVWLISSGQSCTTCHTKQEITARDITSRNILRPDRFLTLYGATFDETFEIAQFYDAQYADAMIFFSKNPDHPANLIRHKTIRLKKTPALVLDVLAKATEQTAVVMRGGRIYAIGTDQRTPFDPFATAEVTAVRNACIRNKNEKSPLPWTVDGELYTTTKEMGPLLFAEAGWTNIGTVCSVTLPKRLKHKQFETRETPKLGNMAFLEIIAGGYHHPKAAIRVFRDEAFVNTAQPQWAEMLRINNEQLYNGAAVSPVVESIRGALTANRFSAPDIRNLGGEARPIQRLKSPSAPICA